MAHRGVLKEFHVGGIVPRQFTFLADGAIPSDCCNPDYHLFGGKLSVVQTATGAAIFACD
jgi:hypothetical protein